VAVAERCGAALKLERVFLVPAYQPPHKLHRVLSPFPARLEMVRVAIADHPRLEVLTLEGERGGVSYTIETLRELHCRFPNARFWLCLGSDSLREIAGWRDPEGIAALARFAVYRRGEEPVVVPPALERRVDLVAGDLEPGSSTEVRERIARGLAVDDLVAPAVLAIIRREGLYAAPTPAAGEGG
jgi:nicotinate-nucleotide adenylyltransferase